MTVLESLFIQDGALVSQPNSHHQSSVQPQMSAAEINDLADEDLAHIFKYLLPKDRLLVQEVCKRWHRISRLPWSDVVTLDLATSVFPTSLEAVIRQCPNLQNVFAKDGYFVQCWNPCGSEMSALSRIRLSSLKLYNGRADLFESDGTQFDLLLAMFSARLPNAAWDELVLHGLKAYVHVYHYTSCFGCSVVATWPLSLKRLQLSGRLNVYFHGRKGEWKPIEGCFLNDLGRLQHLTCLILCSPCSDDDEATLIETALCTESTFQELTALKCLVELCIGWSTGDLSYWSEPAHNFPEIMKVCCGLHKLEVLFLHNVYYSSEEFFLELVTKHPTLRILVMTGSFNDEDFPEEPIPARRLYPNGFGAAPLPFLRVFLDKEGTDIITFTESSSDAVKVYPIIAESLSAFLEKEEIAPLFEGVWIAGQIKEGAKYGAKLCEPLLPIRHAGVDE